MNDELVPNKRNVWAKENPFVGELFKHVKITLTGSEEERLTPDNILTLSKKTYINKRTLNEYFGLTKPRSRYCRISNLNELAKFIRKKDFEAFVLDEKEKQERNPTVSSNAEINFKDKRIMPWDKLRAASKILSNLINSKTFKEDVYQILGNLYDNLVIKSISHDRCDIFAYDSTRKNIEFVFIVLDFNYTPFNQSHLTTCLQIINLIKKTISQLPITSFRIISKTLTCTNEFKTIIEEVRCLEDEKIVEDAKFHDIRSFIREVLELLDIDIRNKILHSNQGFNNKFQEQMNQYFYLENIPFSTGQSGSYRYNAVNYLSKSSILSKDNYSELEYSIGKYPDFMTKKRWNFIISEFGFGKTSLLLDLYKKLYQNNILSFFLPISFLNKDAFNNTNHLCRNILKILYEGIELDFDENYGILLSIVFKRMLEKRLDIVLMFDGLDEHHHAYSGKNLRLIFRCISKLRPECFFTMRKEFWDDKQNNFKTALAGIENKVEYLFLSEWSENEILNFIDKYVEKGGINKIEKNRINEFRELIKNKYYDKFYGDIPRRPLFLKMLIVDIQKNRIKKRNLAEIYEQYLIEKFSIDRVSMFSGKTRTKLRLEESEDGYKILGKIFSVLEKAASLMFVISGDHECILLPSVNENKIEEEIQILKEKEFSITEILLNSIFVPYDKRNVGEFNLKFAHKSFQEYFFARAIYYSLIQPNHSDNLNYILKSKHSDGIVTFMKGIIDSKRNKKAEFNGCIQSLSVIKIENLSPTSLLSLLTGHFSGDIQNLISR